MQHILARRHLDVLSAFASANVLLAFDYDGTLAPIARRPEQARMRRTTRRLLAAVSLRYPAVVISGRSRADLMLRVGAVPVWHVAGNHGLEPWGEEARYHRRVRRWVAALEKALDGTPGLEIEDKTYSVTVHYRRAPQRRAARRRIMEVVGRLKGARTIGGKCAISLVPRGAPDKGAALERARRLLACELAVFVGDDDTDEDAFAAGGPHRLLAIRIGRRRHSRAPYYLSNQREIDAFLRALVALRPLRRAGVT